MIKTRWKCGKIEVIIKIPKNMNFSKGMKEVKEIMKAIIKEG